MKETKFEISFYGHSELGCKDFDIATILKTTVMNTFATYFKNKHLLANFDRIGA
jgi:hypothetical protein